MGKVNDVLKDESKIERVELHFADIHGDLKVLRVPRGRLKEDDVVAFDGSSIAGFTQICNSDLLLRPNVGSFAKLPWDTRAGRFICDVLNTDGSPFEGDPRRVLRRAVDFAKEQGYVYNVGPELEFFLFKSHDAPDTLDDGVYFEPTSSDVGAKVRDTILQYLGDFGFTIEMEHHEVGPSQHEIDFKYGEALETADNAQTLKYVVKHAAREHGVYASFMPKPIQGVNGSGMHVHQSLADAEKKENVFAGGDDLSELAMRFVGGLLHHARDFSAVTAPTVNSYKRLVPGYEAPVYVAWGEKNRSALIRVPYAKGQGARVELRCPDPSANPYLAFAVMLRAGLDGVASNRAVPDPITWNLYEMSALERRKLGVASLPHSLREALGLFEQSDLMQETLGDHAFAAFVEEKYKEAEAYDLQVTEWEVQHYLPRL